MEQGEGEGGGRGCIVPCFLEDFLRPEVPLEDFPFPFSFSFPLDFPMVKRRGVWRADLGGWNGVGDGLGPGWLSIGISVMLIVGGHGDCARL